jgi:hypothetical protein
VLLFYSRPQKAGRPNADSPLTAWSASGVAATVNWSKSNLAAISHHSVCIYAGIGILVAALLASKVKAQIEPPTVRERDGILASIAVDRDQAVVAWRFLQPLPEPLVEFVATFNRRPVPISKVEVYPHAGARSAVVLLLDLSDPTREPQIARDKRALLAMARRTDAHHMLMIGVYASEAQFLFAPDNDGRSVVDMIRAAHSRASPANLGRILEETIQVIAYSPADRRGIYVFTDGHTDDLLGLDSLIRQAKNRDITLNFIVAPSSRTVRMEDLKTLSLLSGGFLIGEDQRENFLLKPFQLLDSGGRLRITLDSAQRFLWEPRAEVNVEFRFGESKLQLTTPAEVPVAGITDTAAYLWRTNPAALFTSGALVLGLCGLSILGVRKRRIFGSIHLRASRSGHFPMKSIEPNIQPIAIIVDIEDNRRYPIFSSPALLGRSSSNDIVLHDKTVSRLHAVLTQDGRGIFSIENRSRSNPIFINGKKLTTSTLADGDLILLGSKKVRFEKPKPILESGFRADSASTNEANSATPGSTAT